jgi:hypothetical protein
VLLEVALDGEVIAVGLRPMLEKKTLRRTTPTKMGDAS